MGYSEILYNDAKKALEKQIREKINTAKGNGHIEPTTLKDDTAPNTRKEFTIIAQSRKGPRCLEVIFKNELDKLFVDNNEFVVNVITEHAIPLFFKRNEGKNIDYIHFDDALYFGTTAESTAKTIDKYCELYNVKFDKATQEINNDNPTFYCAVRSDKTKSGLEESLKGIYPKETINSGDEHFFVKSLLADIRNLKRFFELEFPVIEYKLGADKAIDYQELFNELCKIYDTESTKRVCKVEHIENCSITILLENRGRSLFNKLRIMADKNVVKVMAIAPRAIPDEFHLLKYLFDNGNPLEGLWKEIYECISYGNDRFTFTQETDRRRNKTTIMLANYLFSYDTFIREKENIETLLNRLGGSCEFRGIEERDLFYLTGDKELNKRIKSELHRIYSSGESCGIPNIEAELASFHEQVFEKSSKEFTEKKKFEMNFRNEVMLENCQNLEEALSVLSFNQYIFLDKLTRETLRAQATRLRFGYTFDSLIRNIKKAPKEVIETPNLTLELHKWIDRKIDEGCIVPQYIIDEHTNYWVRVFRPGENEDALLGHLTRFAVFVLENSWETKNLGWISKEKYEQYLKRVFETVVEKGEKIIESQNIEFEVNDKELNVVYKNDNSKTSVSRYMERMSIISIKDNIVKLLPFVIETSLTGSTTLSENDEKKIRNEVEKSVLL